MNKLIKTIKQAEKVVATLTQLALQLGTFIAVIKMIVESLN